jgi:hypothetical protein
VARLTLAQRPPALQEGAATAPAALAPCPWARRGGKQELGQPALVTREPMWRRHMAPPYDTLKSALAAAHGPAPADASAAGVSPVAAAAIAAPSWTRTAAKAARASSARAGAQ